MPNGRIRRKLAHRLPVRSSDGRQGSRPTRQTTAPSRVGDTTAKPSGRKAHTHPIGPQLQPAGDDLDHGHFVPSPSRPRVDPDMGHGGFGDLPLGVEPGDYFSEAPPPDEQFNDWGYGVLRSRLHASPPLHPSVGNDIASDRPCTSSTKDFSDGDTRLPFFAWQEQSRVSK